MSEAQNPNANQGDGGNDNTGNGASGDKWYTSLPADVHEHVQGFEGVEAMVKDYVGLKGRVPQVPEKPEDYPYQAPKDHPSPLSDNEVAQVRKFAKEAGLTKEQFERVIQAQHGIRKQYIDGVNKSIKDAEDALRNDWGNSFDQNLTAADNTINKLFDSEFNDFVKKSGLARNPAFIKGMHKLSTLVSEDSFERGGTTNNQTSSRVDPVTGLPMLKYGQTKK